SSGDLRATINDTDVATAGQVQVTVFSPPPGGTSAPLVFTVSNPLPNITSLSLSSAVAGGAAFTLVVSGSGFVSGSAVRWNGSNRSTTFISNTQLSASIPASDIANAGTAAVTVFNPAPGGGASGAATFTVVNPVPAITSLNPSSATTGSAAFTLAIQGSGFVS